MRFQPRLLLGVGVAIVSASVLGYAFAHTASAEHPITGQADAAHEQAAASQAETGHDHSEHDRLEHDHSKHGHLEHVHQEHNHAVTNPGHKASPLHKAMGLDTPPHAATHNLLENSGQAADTTKYTCPMHPHIITDQPGSCPICGMHLVKLTQGASAKISNQVQVSVQTQQRMGVQLIKAEVASMHRAINAFATILPDETHRISVNSFVEGWIKRWHIRGVGQAVKKGQVLYELYSPELQQRQREYVNTLTRLEAMRANNVSMSMSGPSFVMMRGLAKERFRNRDRLLAAGIDPIELALLEKHRRIHEIIPIRAAQDGVVTEMSAREGSYINPQQPLLVYIDNSMAWAEITLFPDQIAWLKDGDQITMTSDLDTTAKIHASVDLSTLQLDPASRTAKLRLPVSNIGTAFRPGAYAKASIKASERRALSVPRDALIRTGHGQFVVVNESQDHFLSTPVEVGIENESSVEIRSGLEAGASVVINGQFLLDAASSLQAMQNRYAAASIPVGQAGSTAVVTKDIAAASVASAHASAHP